MRKQELQQKLRDIHTLITRSMMSTDDRNVSDDLLIEAEDKLNDLENEIAQEPDSN